MKSFFFILFTFTSISLFSQRVIDSRDLAVLINAEVVLQPSPKVILTWQKNELATLYNIRIKKCNDAAFPSTNLAQLDSTITTYTVPNVVVGECYEFEIQALSKGKVNGGINQFIGFGYISCGVGLNEPTNGTVLLLVDSTFAIPLKVEIDRLIQDMKSEGWGIVQRLTPRAEKFNSKAVQETKNIIKSERQKNLSISTVFLLGRVPVPYSGSIYPDGHPDHQGAWPADVFYGFLNDDFFTDTEVNTVVSGAREETKNIPGDGKYDISSYQYVNVDLAVGRVDMYNMPAFHDKAWANGELELLRRYLNKDHAYRTTKNYAEKRGLITESPSFVAGNMPEAFASSGWRNLGNLLGSDKVNKADWFTTLKDNSYEWAYGTGPGSYQSAGSIGGSADFVKSPIKAVFTMLFGSYFGDWDYQNNFLRAGLAGDGMALTCAWAARPHWFYHHMAVGYPIGYSTKITQNNYNTYLPNYYWLPPQYPNGVIYASGMKNVHISLLGDPTLKLNPVDIDSPKNLIVNQQAVGVFNLSWQEPDASGYTYNVYRSTKENGIYQKLTVNPISDTKYVDNFKYDGVVYYSVRAVKSKVQNCGLVYKNSTAIFGNVNATAVENNNSISSNLEISPNPAVDHTKIRLSMDKSGPIKLEVIDLTGNTVYEFINSQSYSNEIEFNWDLTNTLNQKLDNGVYFIKMTTNGSTIIEKLIVNR